MHVAPIKLSVEKYSAEDAQVLLMFFIRTGGHPRYPQFKANLYDDIGVISDSIVERMLKEEGYPWDNTIDNLVNNYAYTVPIFENLAGGESFSVARLGNGNAKIEVSRTEHDVRIDAYTLEEFGFIGASYDTLFRSACLARDKCIEEGDADHALTMVSKGFSAIEAQLAVMAHVRNEKFPNEPPLIDGPPKRFVSTRDKIKKWVPLITGYRLNIDPKAWQDYLYLESIRNNLATHPKVGVNLNSLNEIANVINKFRSIAGLFSILNLMFLGKNSRYTIRAHRFPDVTVGRSDWV